MRKYDLGEKEELIAPCGMNCSVCASYLALKNDLKSKNIKIPYCHGCRPRQKNCAFIKKRCKLLLDNKVEFCYQCRDFPCERLKKLDKRYKMRYKMSMIDNLNYIKKNSMTKFLDKEKVKWECSNCGETISCHNGICFNCGLDLLKNKKKLYRWED
jgi:hypothetical protein